MAEYLIHHFQLVLAQKELLQNCFAQMVNLHQLMKKYHGFTVSGPAESTIRKLVVDSLASFWRVTGITDEPVVVDLEPLRDRESPHVLIRPEDGSLLDTVKDAAKNAGVLLSCHLWWPGDITPVGHPDLSQPCYVLGVKQRTAV